MPKNGFPVLAKNNQRMGRSSWHIAVLILLLSCRNMPSGDTQGKVVIRKSADFDITGDGSAAAWQKTGWISIPLLDTSKSSYETKVKLLYSATGIYCLYFCEDRKLTATMQQDFMDLWNEDVIEIFLQPDEKKTAYLEYELSPLNYELPLVIFNEGGKLNSWIPFHYDGRRKTRHATSIRGGERKAHAAADSWTAECFIPYDLMKPVLDKPPVSGATWKGNLYRIDYDQGETLWALNRNSGDFHEYRNFGDFYFE